MTYVKQVFRASSVINVVLILKGKINGVRTRDRPRRNWINDIKELTNVKDCTVSLREMQKKGLLKELGTCISTLHSVVGLFIGSVLRWRHLVNACGVISLVRLFPAA